jgi:hypothetical protein
MDFIAGESQFLDHAAPVHRELGGRFLVASDLLDRARSKGIDPELLDITAIRRADPLPPKARPGSGPLAFATSIGDMKIARRLGYRRFVFMEHGVGQSYLERGGINHPSYPGGADREDVELFLVPNEYAAGPWRKAYPGARVEIVGSPRLDDLPRRQLSPVEPGPTVGISFHWRAFVAPEAGTALGHYLTALGPLAERFHVIGHAHPKSDWPVRMERIYRRAGIEFVPDFDDVCRRADVYVCDNSSTIFEFASSGRPVVVLNAPHFRRNVNLGGRFWDWATVGVQVDQPADLIAGIEEALADERQAERERILSLVYQPRTNAAATAATVIRDFLAEREAVAA